MMAKLCPAGREANFHTENGILGCGAAPAVGADDWDLIKVGKRAVTNKPDTAFFTTPTAVPWCGASIWML